MEEERVLSAEEVAEYGEFKRVQREREITLTLKKLVLDASRRENDRASVKRACESAKNLNAIGVLTSPVNAAYACKQFPQTEERSPSVIVKVGGTGESVIAVKKYETKKAVRQGADGIRLVPCYSALLSGEYNYLKREIKTVRRAVKRGTLMLALDDGAVQEKDVALGVRAAVAARADGVSVRGDYDLVLAAVEAAEGKVFVEANGVQNAAQLKLLLRAGVLRAVTDNGDKLAEELRSSANEEPRTVTNTEQEKEGQTESQEEEQ